MSSHHHHHHHHHKHKVKAGHHRNGHSSQHGGGQQQEHENFLVFGYSAKLHNRPEQHEHEEGGTAGDTEESRGLIPWNGDERLKIDRPSVIHGLRCPSASCIFGHFSSDRKFRAFGHYDVRLYLNSLDEFDETERRKRKNEVEEEATAEKLEEELCEEERYTDMYEDIQRRENEEAEQKRGKGAEIGFVYEGDGSEVKKMAEEEEDEDEPYEKPESLKLPVGIVTPDTMRQNALIERTAQFVIAQGPQMEVVIKAKQRQNVEQFGFLDFDHRLHPYYKYLCKLIREKKYTPQPPKIGKKKKVKSPTPSASESDSENEGGYLHPLLTGSSSARAEAASPAPGFFGPSPRPPPQKPEKKPPSPGPNLDALIQQFHRSANENSLYSSLMKGLTSILPGATKIEEKSAAKNEPEQEQQEQPRKSQQQSGGPMYELDEQRIAEYNTWHFDFYGRLSPYLPGPPPAPLPPAPDSAVESGITVAAKYVALHGALAEQRLIEHNRDKVHFLLPRSPYYTFYQSRVRQYQWHLLQQSQQQQQPHIIKIPTAPTPPTLLAPNALIPPQNPDLVPIQMPLDQPQGTGTSDVTAESDPKQVERREKARLFMEKILNERMAEKHRKTKTPAAPTTVDGQEKKKELKSEDKQSASAAQASGTSASASAAVSPLELSKAISCLIDEQLRRTLGTPSPKSPQAAEEPKRKKKRRRRKDSSSSSSSTSSSEDERRRRRRRRKEEEEERRRKRHQDRDSRDRSSSRRRHRRRSHRRNRSESSRSRSRSPRR